MKQRFFIKNIRIILIVCVLIQCLCAGVFLSSYAQIKRGSELNMTRIADRFVENVETDFQNNNTYMNQTILFNKDYRTMFQLTDLELVNRISELQLMYKMLNEMARTPYNFFVYEKEIGKFLELTTVRMDFCEYRKIRKCIVEEVESRPENGKWFLVRTPDQRVILSVWSYQDYVLGSWIDEESFLSGFHTIEWGPGGTVELLEEWNGDTRKTFSTAGNSVLRYSLSKSNADFGIQITIARDPKMLQATVLQVILFVLSSMVVTVMILLIIQVRTNLLVPARRLSETLEKYQHHEKNQKDVSAKKTTVEDAYRILEELGVYAERLTKELYLSEMEKKQLQINFRNLQIKPHFFVNSLAMLSAMAENGEVEKINRLAVCLSDYYRYILQDCMDMVSLRQEVSHMQNVIQVNSEWNNNKLEFTFQMEEGLKDRNIPVMIISTFLENSIKHSTGREGCLKIYLEAMLIREEEEEYLYLRITDNGNGLPGSLTEKLNRGEYIEEKNGRHIGLNNVIQRLKLIYDDKAGIHFGTCPGGGACVEIRIPQGGPV